MYVVVRQPVVKIGAKPLRILEYVQIADFVEKKGTSFGSFDHPFPIVIGSGVCPVFVTEQGIGKDLII
jgi:hypothetical protein